MKRLYLGASIFGILCLGLIALIVTRGRPAKVPLSPEESQLSAAVNGARELDFVPSLKVNPVLCKMARQHAETMARENRLVEPPPRTTIEQELAADGYVAADSALLGTHAKSVHPPREALQNLLRHDASRVSLVNRKFEDVGLAIAQAGDGKYYVVVVVGKKRGD